MMSMTQPIYETDFTAMPAGWITYSSVRVKASNVEFSPEGVSLYTRPEGDGTWRGAALIYTVPFTEGRFTAHIKLEAAHHTKALAMLWPTGDWPPEIDWLEVGEDNWTRQRNNVAAHYGPDDTIIHRSYFANLTVWHTIGVTWRPDRIVWRLDGKVMPNTWGGLDTRIENPGIEGPMTVRLVYWPRHKEPGEPWPDRISRMQVDRVEIFA